MGTCSSAKLLLYCYLLLKLLSHNTSGAYFILKPQCC
jgi:hypothetical protein